MTADLIRALVSEQEEQLIAWRRWLHEHAELSFEEHETSRFIRDRLAELGIPVLPGFSGTSVVADVDSGVPGPVLLFRGDIDALPIQEAAQWDHRSLHDGVMHACGHDFHAANLLSLGAVLVHHPELLQKGRIRLCFEAAEEKIPGGAKTLIEEGVCDGIDLVFAMHSGNNEVRTLAITYGHATLNTGDFLIRVTGKGGHTGIPHKAIDPVACLCDIAVAISRIVPSRLDPARANTVSVSYIHAGNPSRFNVIPGSGELGGTVRCLYSEDQNFVNEEIRNIAESICRMRGCTCEVEAGGGYPGMINDDACMDAIKRAAEKLNLEAIETPAVTVGDDFSYYQLVRPGGYFSMGLSNPEKPEVNVLHHNPSFFVDESGMRYALEMFLALIDDICNS